MLSKEDNVFQKMYNTFYRLRVAFDYDIMTVFKKIHHIKI